MCTSRKYSIHTPTKEGISHKPPSSPEFPFFDYKNNSPTHHPPSGISTTICTPPIPSRKIVLARKCVKVKVNTPNMYSSALHVTVNIHDQSLTISNGSHFHATAHSSHLLASKLFFEERKCISDIMRLKYQYSSHYFFM